MKVLRRAAAALVLLAIAAAAVYWLRPDPAPPVDFSEDLKGPSSGNFIIPFEVFALTPEGLLRAESVTGRAFGNHRLVAKTVSGEYLSRDFVFEIDVTIPPGTDDLAYVGFGAGDPNPGYNDEPAGAFIFRIHNLPGFDVVHAAAGLPAKATSDEAGPGVYAKIEPIGRYVAGVKTTFRIEHAGTKVMLSMPATPGASYTFDTAALPPLFGRGEGYLFFGNSAEGTVFSNVRVRPRG